jgi:hypothetical protein
MRVAAFVMTAALSLAGTAACSQGVSLVVLADPVAASSLSGVVVDPNGAVIPHASVGLITCPARPRTDMNSTVLSATETDSRGRFSIKRGKFGAPYCLHLSAPGFDPMELEVKISAFAGAMRLTMVIAT